MMIRSTPPISSNFAEMPVPAPPPIIGRSAATILCRRSRTCLRVNPIVENERQRTPANVNERQRQFRSLVFVDVRWCSLSFVGVHCRSLVFTVVRWCSLSFAGVHCRSLVCTVVRWCSLCYGICSGQFSQYLYLF